MGNWTSKFGVRSTPGEVTVTRLGNEGVTVANATRFCNGATARSKTSSSDFGVASFIPNRTLSRRVKVSRVDLYSGSRAKTTSPIGFTVVVAGVDRLYVTTNASFV